MFLMCLTYTAQAQMPTRFRIDVTQMNPPSDRAQTVEGYYVEIRDSLARVHVPYITSDEHGVNYQDVLMFTEKMYQTKHRQEKKGRNLITFHVTHGIESTELRIRLYPEGMADVTIRTDKQAYRYQGRWDPIDKKE